MLHSKKSGKRKRHVPKHLRSLRVRKRRLYKLSKTNPDAKIEYLKLEKLYKKSSREYFSSLEEKVISSGCKKNFYNYVNQRLKSRSFIPPLINPADNTVATSSSEKAELLNAFFVKCYQDDKETIAENHLPKPSIQTVMPEMDITKGDILMAIKKLKCSVSRTPEGIPALFVKRTGTNLLAPLLLLFKQSLHKGTLPSDWGQALVVPIHKKGLRSSANNYRPVSLTSVFCRLFETVLHNYVYCHLEHNNLISNVQHGFVRNRSTMTNQLLMLDVLTTNYDQNIQTEMILLDYSKTFDMVPHRKLLAVLTSYKVHHSVVQWIKNLLLSRTQQTVVENFLSKRTKVPSGVPQGSVIGPLLFIIYITTLLEKLKSFKDVFVFAFADDIKLISKNQKMLQQALQYVEKWCSTFKLKLNREKSEHICFRKHIDYTFQICGGNIKKVDTTKDLGVNLNNRLKWQSHTSKLSSKALAISYIILRSFTNKNKSSYMKAYKTYARPLLEYNSVIWNTCNIGETQLLEKVQKTFTRRLLQKLNIKYTSYEDRLRILGIESLELRRFHFDLITVYKIVNRTIDLDFDQFFKPLTTVYDMRHHRFALKKPPLTKTKILNSYFKNRIINAWNSLPESCVTAETLALFKLRLRNTNLNSFLLNNH